MQNKQPRAHHDIIIAWAGGAEIQFRMAGSAKWVDSDTPAFVADYEYRVKPAREYPQTKLTSQEIARIFANSRFGWEEGYIDVANAALKHAIDAGQVVTREEFDRAIGDRATRDLNVSIAVRNACRNITVGHAMRSGVVEDIERLDLFAIIDGVKA